MANPQESSLTIVGTGIAVGAQTTIEAKLAIEEADRVLYLVADPIAEGWLRKRNPNCEDLRVCYQEGRPRREAYAAMVARVLEVLGEGGHVVLAAYGHPGVFAGACHDALAAARAAGYEVLMQPAVGADSCIWADLCLDPGAAGCQMAEATDWLLRLRPWDPTSLLVLWQVGAIGALDYRRGGWDVTIGLRVLASRLAAAYPPAHPACLYEASISPLVRPRAAWIVVGELAGARVTGVTTLVIPGLPARGWDYATALALGLA